MGKTHILEIFDGIFELFHGIGIFIFDHDITIWDFIVTVKKGQYLMNI